MFRILGNFQKGGLEHWLGSPAHGTRLHRPGGPEWVLMRIVTCSARLSPITLGLITSTQAFLLEHNDIPGRIQQEEFGAETPSKSLCMWQLEKALSDSFTLVAKPQGCGDKLIPRPWLDSQVGHSLFSWYEAQLANLPRETDTLV